MMQRAAEETFPPIETGNIAMNLVNVILVLAVIVILIVLLIRFLGRRNLSMTGGRPIRTIGAVGVGPNKSLQIIELGGSLYLIGVGENISMLDKISDPAEVSSILSALEEHSTGQNLFPAKLISKLRSRGRDEVQSQDVDLDRESPFYDMLQQKLNSAPGRKEKLEQLLRDEAKKDENREQ
jgi:flagellar protein FliO/FliZ